MKKTINLIISAVLIICMVTAYPSPVAAAKLLATPRILQVRSVDSGTCITWSKVSGAKRFRVFYKTASGWKKLGDTKTNSFTDKAVKSGTVRTYTVRCIDATGKKFTSDYNRRGTTYTYNMITPVLRQIASTKNGVSLSWQAVKEAKRYRVFRKNGASWKKLADVTGINYTDKSVSAGKQYTYTVRCLSYDKKKYTSLYNKKGLSIIWQSFETEKPSPTEPETQIPTEVSTQAPTEAVPPIPIIDSLTCTNDSVIIRWTPIEKVQSYYLYYKKEGQDWKFYTYVKNGEYEFYNSNHLKEGQAISFALQYDKFKSGKTERIADTIGKTIVFHSTGILPDLTTERPQWFKPAKYQTVDNIRFDLSYAGESSYTIGKDEVTTSFGEETYNDISYTLYADASIDPDALTVKVNNGNVYDIDRADNVHYYKLDTEALQSDSPDSEVFRERLKALKATKELPSYSCRINGDRGYAVASVRADYSRIRHKEKLSRYYYDDYYPNGTLKLTIKVKTVFAQKANFPIDVYYHGKSILHTTFKLDLVKGVSNRGSYDKRRDFLDNAEAACWKSNMTSTEKMSALARYLNKNYTYGEMICCNYAEYMMMAAQDLGLPAVLVVPAVNVYSNDNGKESDSLLKVYLQEIGYPVIFNIYEYLPGIHCYCLAKQPDGAYYQYEGTGGKNGSGGYIAEKTKITDENLYQKRGMVVN